MQELENVYDEINKIICIRNNKNKPKAFVRTYGCQQNVSDSEKFKGMLMKMGFSITNEANEADFILFNTCAIREHAEDKVYGNVGALKHYKNRNKNLFIALCGCMMEQEFVVDKIKKSYPFVNLVFGTKSMASFPILFHNALISKKRSFIINKENMIIPEDMPIRRDGNFKAWLPIMYGCNNYCTYCIVPYVRGKETSREPQKIINEAKNLINSGYKEITLLGQNVNSYGKNLSNKINFAELLKNISSIKGDYWLRFVTSHPKDLTHELIDTMASSKKICNHLHLPVQSGSDRVLKEMNRKYTRESYLNLIKYAKNKIPDISFTSDIIVGFPTETYEDFKETLSLIREVEYTSLFTFIYSPRKGTVAASMENNIPDKEKMKWFNELLEVQKEVSTKIYNSMVGKIIKVLVEDKSKNGKLSCRAENNIIVEVKGNSNLVGLFKDVKIIDVKNMVLIGEFIN